jgi:DNA-binding MarR family transcriptional regulator
VIPLQTHYGFLIRILHWCNSNSMDSAMENLELTGSQGHIMAYLAHAKTPPCPRDLEAVFHLTHPTVSGLLSRLEQKGFVQLRTDPEDRRVKRIYVLEKGLQCHEVMHSTILENEQRIVAGFTPEEQEIFSDLLERAIRNMGADPTPRRFKEDNK